MTIRWWNEFRNPKLKCDRRGHRLRRRWYLGFENAKPNPFRYVAYKVKGEIEFCGRCGVVMKRDVQLRDGTNSLTMDDRSMRILERDGFVELDAINQ